MEMSGQHVFDSTDSKGIGKTTGEQAKKFQINVAAGNHLIPVVNPAFSKECHVSQVDGKTSLKDSDTMARKTAEALKNPEPIVRKDGKDVFKTQIRCDLPIVTMKNKK